ncbi:uncharacterized protein G2W53_027273 [Senna tora]|uniref:Uncharacterized protein n=1 Tax=Senna tora TaxID=362788 RepID=A0A834TGJ7_9FABA|nr:uncharacterized protein G2W53_027273 [Senna tora]
MEGGVRRERPRIKIGALTRVVRRSKREKLKKPNIPLKVEIETLSWWNRTVSPNSFFPGLHPLQGQRAVASEAMMCGGGGDEDKYPSPEDIDRISSAEIPDKNSDSELYELVVNFMIHGPCGAINRNSPSCEAAWRIFGSEIHHRQPYVDRLTFHLPNEQAIINEDHENLDHVMNKSTVNHSMFTTWMQANQDYEEARELTYSEFPTKFIYNSQERKWYPRKRGFSIGSQTTFLESKSLGAICFSILGGITSDRGAKKELCTIRDRAALKKEWKELKRFSKITTSK